MSKNADPVEMALKIIGAVAAAIILFVVIRAILS